MKYSIKDINPKDMCMVGACPSIYEGLKELTPQEMKCLIGTCPSTYEGTRKGKEVYLIVGKVIDPSEAGLEGKIGEGEVLIEIPKDLIDKIKK